MHDIPDDESEGKEIFIAMSRAVDKGLDPEAELRNFLKKYLEYAKKF